MAVEGELVYQLSYEGNTYEWCQYSDMTLSFLHHCKDWFGADYGTIHGLNRMLLMGDGDAVLCVLWGASKKKAKERDDASLELPFPREMPDLSIGELLQGAEVGVAKAPGKGSGSSGRANRTRRSAATSTNSAESGSGQ